MSERPTAPTAQSEARRSEAAHMHYPVLDGAGRLFDLFTKSDDRDPLVSPCPPWCGDRHPPTTTNEDRRHLGELHAVAVADMRGEYSSNPACRGAFSGFYSLYLKQDHGQAEPRVWLGRGESDTGDHLTLNEAEDLIAVLQRLVRLAEFRR